MARIVIEAKTPLNIGSGNKGIKSDSLVLRDINGLPFIPGTTIAGLLRHSISIKREENEKDEDYKYFATEHLSDVRHRIESYLEKTTMKFTSPVYDYKKYDRILEERKELRKNSKYTAGLKKWQKTCYIDAEVKHIELYINNIKDYTQALKQAVTSSTINYIETENLLETIKLLEKVEKDLEITIKER